MLVEEMMELKKRFEKTNPISLSFPRKRESRIAGMTERARKAGVEKTNPICRITLRRKALSDTIRLVPASPP
jgi:hypothetical protein